MLLAGLQVRETEYNAEFDEGDMIGLQRDEQAKKMIAISQRDDIYELLANSVAPSIYENEVHSLTFRHAAQCECRRISSGESSVNCLEDVANLWGHTTLEATSTY